MIATYALWENGHCMIIDNKRNNHWIGYQISFTGTEVSTILSTSLSCSISKHSIT